MVHRQHYPEGNEIKAMAESITLAVDKLSEELESDVKAADLSTLFGLCSSLDARCTGCVG